MRFPQFIAATWLALVCASAPAHAEKRVALVIGNSAYQHADELANPVNDAQAIREALKRLGFDVIYGENLDLKGLGRAIGQFAGRVEKADVAIVYFAGHGSTFDGVSYVVPVDAEFASLTEVPHELIPVETMIADLRRAKGVRIAILDACRDNGAEQELKRHTSRGGGDNTRGLAPIKNASGLIIAYATQYGATAADAAPGGHFSSMRSSLGHSPFTTALLNNIATPGLDVKDMFFKVGSEVDAVSGGKQRPEISISTYGHYVLATKAPTLTSPAVTAPPRPADPQQMAAAPPLALSPLDSPVSEAATGDQTAKDMNRALASAEPVVLIGVPADFFHPGDDADSAEVLADWSTYLDEWTQKSEKKFRVVVVPLTVLAGVLRQPVLEGPCATLFVKNRTEGLLYDSDCVPTTKVYEAGAGWLQATAGVTAENLKKTSVVTDRQK